MAQTSELDFVFEIAEAPIAASKAQKRTPTAEQVLDVTTSEILTQRDIQNIWSQACKSSED